MSHIGAGEIRERSSGDCVTVDRTEVVTRYCTKDELQVRGEVVVKARKGRRIRDKEQKRKLRRLRSEKQGANKKKMNQRPGTKRKRLRSENIKRRRIGDQEQRENR